MSLVTDFQRARRISTPIIAIQTADQEATITTILGTIDGLTPAVRYDVALGPRAARADSAEDHAAVFAMDHGEEDVALILAEDPARAMVAALQLEGECILFFLNAHRQLGDARVAQAIARMRDDYKTRRCTIVLLAPGLSLPDQLAGDVMLLDEPLPGSEEIDMLLTKTYSYFPGPPPLPDADTRKKAIDSVKGLHAAAIEQTFSFAMEPTGVDISLCWQQKRSRIEQTRGLTFYRGGETYADIGGLAAFKSFMKEVQAGPEPAEIIVWVDEIEKAIAGSTGYHGDGGVNADQLGVLLTNMEDNGWSGAIAVGPTGAGKSIIAKATGNTFGIPCLRMDLGAMKGGIVGESESYIRQAMKVLHGMAGHGAFFIATCNAVSNIPPELKRRFCVGRTWFFDLPDREEKDSIWRLQTTAYKLPAHPQPDDTDWTGSDIRDCCCAAWRRRRSVTEIAKQIVPFAKSDPERLASLRDLADGRFLSASYEGVYRKDHQSVSRRGLPTDRKTSFN